MTNHYQQAVWNEELILKYNVSGPRYTSYPTALQFREFSADDFLKHAQQTVDPHAPLSLYVHVPFCQHVCFYCGCNKVATKNVDRADRYLDALEAEMKLVSHYFSGRPVKQLHWGGGTPTFLSDQQTLRLWKLLKTHFSLLADDIGEYSIEIDPRVTSPQRLNLLRELGFNRISLGVQDFNPETQAAINRLQSVDLVEQTVKAGRDNGFFSISFDLIYGLPLQTVESFDKTLDEVIALDPDRIAVYNYAHLPERFKPQRRINVEELPRPGDKLSILEHCIRKLQQAGYVYIGMDHFAKPDDDLVKAQQDGTLQRNFQGYSTHGDIDLLGMGVSSISYIEDCFIQNDTNLDSYEEKVLSGQLASSKGYVLSDDDKIRQRVIKDLSCNGRVIFDQLDDQFDIDSRGYFHDEIRRLDSLARDGLVRLTDRSIEVTPQGRLLLRPVCMVFDAYLKDSSGQQYSKVV